MKILVTGVTGMVGARLLPRLVEAGFDCRALVRKGKEVPSGVTAVEADLFDADSLARAVEGVEAIVHFAAVFRTQDEDLIWKSNLEGTRNLIAAAKALAPKARFIMASTSNIYDMDAGRPGREDDESSPKQAYPASKLAAETELRDSGLNWAVLRFSFVYGDGDGHIEMMPRMAAQTKFHPAKRMSMVHHQDIATGVKLALTGALDGHIVNLADRIGVTPHMMIRATRKMGLDRSQSYCKERRLSLCGYQGAGQCTRKRRRSRLLPGRPGGLSGNLPRYAGWLLDRRRLPSRRVRTARPRTADRQTC